MCLGHVRGLIKSAFCQRGFWLLRKIEYIFNASRKTYKGGNLNIHKIINCERGLDEYRLQMKGKINLKLIPKLLPGIQNVTCLMKAMWRMHFKVLKTSWGCFSFLKFYFACLFQYLTLLCCGAGKYIPTRDISARPYFRHLGSVGWGKQLPGS